ncbi:MAG: hypothetical protein P4L49_10515 [Desulfosporosinus sp.]|nr:hypothetical protein [Desulfosporosinus sp.]
MFSLKLTSYFLDDALNSRYVNDEGLNEEVLSMTRTLYDPIVAEKAKLEGKLEGELEAALNALIKGIEPTIIAKITGLSLETVQKLKAELAN